MSDDVTPTIDDDKGGNSGFTPPATQDELNRIIADRVSREKAKFADYNDLKTKATEFDRIAEAQKSETQKALERAEAAEKALAATQSESLRLTVIARHGIPEDYQDFVFGGTEEELTARAEKVKALIQQPTDDGTQRLVIPFEGGSPNANTALNSDALLDSLKAAVGIA